MRRIPLILALASLSIAAGASAAPPDPSAPAETAKPSAADQARLTAIRQYQHDLVSVVALRADPAYLLGAALLARPFTDQPQGLDFDSLSARALAAPDAGPAIEWVRLSDCGKDDCPNAKAFAALQKKAAGNAAVWLVALDLAAAKHDADAERAALKQAAGAPMYDDYYGAALQGVADAVSVLPPLPDTIHGAHDGQPDNPDGVRVLVAVENTGAHPRPNLEPLLQVCGKHAADKDAGIKADCLKLAHTLEWGSSPIARAVGLHIKGELDAADKPQTDEENRNLAWQMQNYSMLLQHSLTEEALAKSWLDMARNGGTELSLVLATLRANGISTDAPASFTGTASPAAATSSAH